MLSQGPEETLGWLAGEAHAWEGLHDRAGAVAPEVADFWAERARACRRLLNELRLELRRDAAANEAEDAGEPDRERRRG